MRGSGGDNIIIPLSLKKRRRFVDLGPSFVYDVLSYDHVRHEYTLKCEATGVIKKIDKDRFCELMMEQKAREGLR